MKNDDSRMEIEQLSDADARAHLKETYADPESAERFFDQLIETRQKSLDSLAEELNGDERLSETFARNPLGFLNDRKLLGPLDQITLEGLRNPFIDWPWPWPICRIRCRLEAFTEVQWVCIGFWPLRLCWPVFHIRFRWVCRIVCD
jgi:hypothetical protein